MTTNDKTPRCLAPLEIKALVESEKHAFYEANKASEDYVVPPLPQRRDFLVAEENLDGLKGKLDKLIRRAAKLGVTPISYIVGDFLDEKIVKVDDITGINRTKIVRYYAFHVDGVTPKLNGWTFAATLQHLDGGDTIIRNITDLVVPVEYRTAENRCDHCKTLRRRIDTYLVYHVERNEWKQIGRNCVRDFLGSVEAEVLARQAEYLREALEIAGSGEDEGGSGGSGGKVKSRYLLAEVLTLTVGAIEQFGWLSRSKAKLEDRMATADIVNANLWQKYDILKKDGLLIEHKEGQAGKAENALMWAREICDADVEKNEYLYNIRTIANLETVEPRLLGYACSIIAAFDRETEKKARIQAEAKLGANSNHVGTVGERLENIAVTVVGSRDFEGDYGVKTLVTFVDSAGNRMKWWSTNGGLIVKTDGNVEGRRVEVGETIAIKGTVKKHEEYRGVKETVLSRCDVFVPKIKKAKKAKTETDAKA